MQLKSKNISYFLAVSLALSGSAFAAAPPPVYYHNATMPAPAQKSPDRFEFLGGLGVAQMDAENGELGITPGPYGETDRLVPRDSSNGWNTFAVQGGFGYMHYFGNAQRYSEHAQWFPAIEPELNVYYIGENNVNGDVWLFDMPSFNTMTYSMPFDSTRLMFDTALTIVSKKWASLYAIGGIGNAWNRFGYNDANNPNSSCPEQTLVLNSNTHSDFAWEAGGGLSFLLGKRVSLFLEYLYTDLGKGQTSVNGSTGTIGGPLSSPATFDLSAQTGLIGLHVAI